MPIQSILGSLDTVSHTDPELVEIEAMDLETHLLKLEKIETTSNKSKSKVVDEALGRIRVWQSSNLDLDGGKDLIDYLMKDLNLLHRENVAPHLIVEVSFSQARDVAIVVENFEDVKSSLENFGFYKTTHEANMADYQK